ncbi:virulence protein RhuM/Fic/DOC family protein [Aquisalimonas lutea]|uniref:virulence protein RhuM/Fic/DOC family protein n=1 Tax=Aquisalimonas lutea TaxID=1327750 RepID=UPI0025B5A197|nr:virulence protein RhuM/Fic/DOC family protein [Aquisalimonas lutea]MDN3517254.1 virulence protein RhuM/Fic/DOC family protein [Aquisalimonas lutea]
MTEVVIYESAAGSVEVRLEHETVWLRQEQLAELFGRDRTVIGRHIRNVFKEGELDEATNVQNMHIPSSDKPVRLYSLDVIISVGYRVKSHEGVRFRQWASHVLKDYLTQGYAVDRARFEANARELEAALELVRNTARTPALTTDAGRALVDVVTRYANTFLLLQRYDEGLLTEPPATRGGTLPTVDEAQRSLNELKRALIARGEATELFAQERGDGLASLLGNLDQTVFGEPAYPSVESKAAHLLYFVVKNHPFADGNKRSAAYLMVDFLSRNNGLMDAKGEPVINDNGLAALTLLVAESQPAQKETMIHLIMNMLAPPGSSTEA